MASEGKRHPRGPAPDLGPPPSPPEAGFPAVDAESSAPPAEPPSPLAQPVSPGDPGFRLLLEENTFQALAQEPLLKRPRTSQDAPSVGKDSLLCLPFPKKLWALVNSPQFASIWWARDGTCIGINEKLFQKEVLEREGPDKVFETDCMKSFVRQLNLYGFGKLRRDVHTSICLTNVFPGGAPVRVLSKLQFYRSPFFQRDCPHLLLRMKRRVGVKSTPWPAESEPHAPEGPPAAATPSPPPEGVLPSSWRQPKPVSSPPPRAGLATRVRSESAPPAILRAAAGTTWADPHAAVGRALGGHPQGAQAPVPLAADVAGPAAFPWGCVALPPAQIHARGPPLGLAPGPPVLLPVPSVQLPVARLLPLCQPWVPGMPAGPAAPVTVIPQPLIPFHGCPDCHCFPAYLPLTARPPAYPQHAQHRI